MASNFLPLHTILLVVALTCAAIVDNAAAQQATTQHAITQQVNTWPTTARPISIQQGVSQRVDEPAPFQVTVTGTGQPMILIPGLLSPGEVWDGTVAAFGDDYELHVLTLAGFAGAPPTGADPFLATTRDAIIDYILKEGMERPVLMGHSLGAFLALWTAATAPDLVGDVVAVDGVPFLSALSDPAATPERMRSQAEAARAMFSGMTREAMATQARMTVSQQARDTVWHSRAEEWGAASDPVTVGRAVAEMMTTDIRDEVAHITSRVLLIMAGNGMPPGMRDDILDRYRAQLDRVHEARVLVAANARHFVMLDDPDFLHAAVGEFLEAR